jgi:hypothetical protein
MFFCICLNAQDNGLLLRRVTFNFRNTSIEEILKNIETEDFAFTYSAEIFDVKKRVSISVKEETIAAVLEKLFIGQNMECQQMGNKLLIRKKRVPLSQEVKIDSIKPTEKPKVKVALKSNEQVTNQIETNDKPQKIIQNTASEAKPSSAITEISQNETPNLAEELALYYAQERVRTTAFLAKYITIQKRPFVFEFGYLPLPKKLKPIPQKFNIVKEVEVKAEKVKVAKDPDNDKRFRLYLSPNVGYTEINKRDAILIGGSLVYNTNKHFGIGVAGKGFISRAERDNLLNDEYSFAGGYGGILFETTLFPNQAFHISIPILFAAGEYTYSNLNQVSGIDLVESRRMIFVLEPAVNFEMNIFKYMRMGLGVAYRDASSTDLTYQTSQDPILAEGKFEGLSFNIQLKFGWF